MYEVHTDRYIHVQYVPVRICVFSLISFIFTTTGPLQLSTPNPSPVHLTQHHAVHVNCTGFKKVFIRFGTYKYVGIVLWVQVQYMRTCTQHKLIVYYCTVSFETTITLISIISLAWDGYIWINQSVISLSAIDIILV